MIIICIIALFNGGNPLFSILGETFGRPLCDTKFFFFLSYPSLSISHFIFFPYNLKHLFISLTPIKVKLWSTPYQIIGKHLRLKLHGGGL